MKCKRCNNTNIVKNGSRRGKPCFLCKDCNHQFTSVNYKAINDEQRNFEICAAVLLRKKLTFEQTAQLLGRKLATIQYWVGRGRRSLPKIKKSLLIKYLTERESGSDILFLLGFAEPDTKPSDNLLKILIPKPKKEKGLTQKEIARQEQIKEQERSKAIYEKRKRHVIDTPITDRKNAVEKLLILFNCSKRLLLGLRYSDLGGKNVGDSFIFKCFVEFVDRNFNIKIHEAVSLFDRNKNSGYILTAKIKEIVLWLKNNGEENRQKLGAEYDNTYDDWCRL